MGHDKMSMKENDMTKGWWNEHWKRKWNDRIQKSTSEIKAGLDSISAILNKHGKGVLYFGVKDNGEICGQQIGKETTRDISREIRNKIKPECEFEVNTKSTSDNKSFIEEIPKKSFNRYNSKDKIISNINPNITFNINKFNLLKHHKSFKNSIRITSASNKNSNDNYKNLEKNKINTDIINKINIKKN